MQACATFDNELSNILNKTANKLEITIKICFIAAALAGYGSAGNRVLAADAVDSAPRVAPGVSNPFLPGYFADPSV